MKAKIELRSEISFQREDNVCSIGETKGFTVCIFVLPSVQAPKTMIHDFYVNTFHLLVKDD